MANTQFQKIAKQGQTLEEAVKGTKPLQQIAADQGQLQPTDQLSAVVLGGNKNQAKMVGGQPQLRNAIQKNVAESKDLATQQREAQPRRGATEAEKQQIEQQQRLQKLGSLDSRVENLVNQKMDLTNHAATLDVDTANFPTTLSEENKPRVKELAVKAANGQASVEETAELNTLMGRDINSPLRPEEIQQWLKSPETIAGENAAKEIQNGVKVSELAPTELGYQNWSELSQDLGVDAATLQEMTVTQLIDAVQKKQRADFASADRWRQILADPTSSANDRQEAQRVLREMGAVGIRQADDNMEKLSADIQAANTVTFGGEEYTVEELLSDATVAQIAKDYFTSPDKAAAIQKQNPGLAGFFDQHKELLADAAKNIQTETGDLEKILEERRSVSSQLKDIFGPAYKDMFPDADKISTTPAELPKYLQEKDKFDGSNLATLGMTVGDLYKLNPDFAKSINSMDYNQLKDLGLTSKAGQDSFVAFAKMQNLLNQDLSKLDVDNVVSAIYGDEEALRQNVQALQSLGIPVDNILDANHDGKLDTTNEIASRLKQKYGNQDLVSGYKGNNPQTAVNSLAQQVSQFQNPNTVQGALFSAYKNDGKVDETEAQGIGSQFQAKVAKGDLSGLSDLKQLSSTSPLFNKYYQAASFQAAESGLAKKGMQGYYQTMNAVEKFPDDFSRFSELQSMAANILSVATNTRDISPDMYQSLLLLKNKADAKLNAMWAKAHQPAPTLEQLFNRTAGNSTTKNTPAEGSPENKPTTNQIRY